MIGYDYLCNDTFGTTSLDLLVVSSIGITITRDGEDDSPLEILDQSLFNAFDIK
jgi:hypothetical protein